MADETVIRSRSNALIQRVRALVSGKERDAIVLEGDRLVDDAVTAKRVIEVVLVAHDRIERAGELSNRGARVQLVDAEILAQASALETSPGILALGPLPQSIDLAQLALDTRSLVLVVAGIADPGNLGALSRTAEAFGACAFVVIAGGASPWNAKALRGSMGSLLRLPVAHGIDADACSAVLGKRGARQVVANTRGGADPSRFDWKGPLALWVGAETGAMPAVTKRFEGVTIPIRTDVESLNVTVAASILLFAAGRVART
ncbi:MAG: RNA methyltransferase [Planctomycetota bacterium]|nr:RNA methyltransferase [Planctomycetota bacterium]